MDMQRVAETEKDTTFDTLRKTLLETVDTGSAQFKLYFPEATPSYNKQHGGTRR
jgi:hypothetical protein